MKLRLAAFILAFLLSGCASPPLRSLDSGPAWACTSRTSTKDIDLSAIRNLDAQGRQIDANYQWSIGGFDRGRLALMAMQRINNSGDPSVPPREVLISWSGFPDRLQRQRMLIILHSSGEPPNALDAVAMIPYANGLIGAVMSWQRVASLAHHSPDAQLSLMDAGGRVVRSASVDLTRLHPIEVQTRAALDETRDETRSFEKKCEAITERMRL